MLNILIVDPDKTARETEAAMLQALGFEAITAATTQEALTALATTECSLVLTEADEVLAGGGPLFLANLNLCLSGKKPVPVVILGASSSDLPQDVAALRQAGFADV